MRYVCDTIRMRPFRDNSGFVMKSGWNVEQKKKSLILNRHYDYDTVTMRLRYDTAVPI